MKPQLFVIKIGGNVIDDELKLSSFLKDLAAIKVPCILVHGGGKVATRIGEQLGIESKYIAGRRITDDATIDLVTMVYGGLVNKQLVAKLQSLGRNAIGLTGADANLIPAAKRPVELLDYGWVGDVDTKQIVTKPLMAFLDLGIMPVFAPLTHDGNGHLLNTNADTIAASLAVALSPDFAVRLLYCFEKRGVLENVDDEGSVITTIDLPYYAELKASGKLFAGMLPKIDNAFAAIAAGVESVLIGHADNLLQNTTATTVGTLIQ